MEFSWNGLGAVVLVAATAGGCAAPKHQEPSGEDLGPEPLDLVEPVSMGELESLDVRPVQGASLRGLSVPAPGVVWVSGSDGVVARTIDSGATWIDAHIEEAVTDGLDLRSLVAFDALEAWAASAGEGEASRLFHTTDGGASWETVLRNEDPLGFYDGLAFWDRSNGMLLGDPTDGYLTVMVTGDAGKSWERVGSPEIFGLPTGLGPDPVAPANADGTAPEAAAPLGEYCFAASNRSIALMGRSTAWIGTGGKVARVFKTGDRGRTWSVAGTPLLQNNGAAGVFALAFADSNFGVAVGGDYTTPTGAVANCAVTTDGGETWVLASDPPRGYRSAVCFFPGSGDLWMSVGTSGADLSKDSGATAWPFAASVGEGTALNSVATDPEGRAAWCVGAGGYVGRMPSPLPEIVWN